MSELTVPDPEYKHVTKAELQHMLKLHRNTVSKLLAEGHFPNAFLLPKGQWRIPMSDVLSFIEKRRTHTSKKTA